MSVTLALSTMACGPDAAPTPPPHVTTPETAPSPESVADPGFIEQYTVTYRFNQGHPGAFAFLPDASAVLFLRSGARSFVQDLFLFEVATGTERPLLTAEQVLNGAEEELSAEERARRERMRSVARGIASFQLSPDGGSILVPLSGRLFLVDRAHAGEAGSVRELVSSAGSANDARFSPDGRSIAVVREGDLYVMDVASGSERRLTTRASTSIEYGTAEFVAQEEMSRFEGYWWSPDSATLLVEEADSSAVEAMHILDPLHPENEPESPPYPRPGRENVRVRLGILPASGGAMRWVSWDAVRYPYLATGRWPANRGPVILVQDREQQHHVLLSIDPATGDTREMLAEEDGAWLNLDQDVPRFLADGTFLWTSERGGSARLELRGTDGSLLRALTPETFGYASLVGLDEAGRRAFVLASQDASQMHVWSVSLDAAPDGAGTPTQLSEGEGVNEAVFAEHGDAWVHVARAIGAARTATVRRADGTAAGVITANAEAPTFTPTTSFEVVGERAFRAAITRPRNYAEGTRYPVLLYVYAGPGVRHVLRDRDRWLLPQWFADNGYIVVSIDGRGTPGRGRDWERAIDGDFATVALEDQVAGLQALGANHPEMDLSRVGVYGWSFGGYFAAMATIRRPEIFRCGIAGAPVTEWRDYDTHYTERYLGLPEADDATDGPYRRSSVLTYAAAADGDRRALLIVHGTADDNVYFSHALKLTDAMLRAGRPFDLLPLAGFTHMVPEPVVAQRLNERMIAFFREHL